MSKKVLVLDVGGTNLKILMPGAEEPVKVPSGTHFTPRALLAGVKKVVGDKPYDVVTIGVPAVLEHGKIVSEPRNLGLGWVKYDFQKALGKPVKMINDAAMQALGSYDGGTMLFLGLGTGLGTAVVAEGHVVPMELAHLPFRKGEFEDYVGVRGLEKYGKKKWRDNVAEVVSILKAAVVADYVVLGGGQTKLLKELPEGCRRGDNFNAFKGGQRLWD